MIHPFYQKTLRSPTTNRCNIPGISNHTAPVLRTVVLFNDALSQPLLETFDTENPPSYTFTVKAEPAPESINIQSPLPNVPSTHTILLLPRLLSMLPPPENILHPNLHRIKFIPKDLQPALPLITLPTLPVLGIRRPSTVIDRRSDRNDFRYINPDMRLRLSSCRSTGRRGKSRRRSRIDRNR